MRKWKRFLCIAASLCLAGLSACGGEENSGLSLDEVKERQGSFSAGASVHDPSIYEENGTY